MRFRKKARQFRFVVKRSSKTTIAVVCATVAVCLVTLFVIHAIDGNNRNEIEKWKNASQQAQQENQKWNDRNANAGTAEDLKDYAEENLGLVDEDTVVITPKK